MRYETFREAWTHAAIQSEAQGKALWVIHEPAGYAIRETVEPGTLTKNAVPWERVEPQTLAQDYAQEHAIIQEMMMHRQGKEHYA